MTLCERHACGSTRPIAMSPSLATALGEAEMEEKETVPDKEEIPGHHRRTIWLSVRTRPDLAYVVGCMGRQATKNPVLVQRLGKEAVELAGTMDMELIYGKCDEGADYGSRGSLAFGRSMRRLEAYADVSFAPSAARSVQGVIVAYGGCPIQWESNRQTCCALSTAEGELYTYIEAMTMLNGLAGVVEELEDVEHDDTWRREDPREPGEVHGEGGQGGGLHKVIYGDNTAAIAVLCSPQGPWRTRHLRLRSNVLRERLRNDSSWSVRHLPGQELVADYLTKPISPRSRWRQFFDFMKMKSQQGEEEKTEQGGMKKLLTHVAMASAGLVGLHALHTAEGSVLSKVKMATMAALTGYVAKKVAELSMMNTGEVGKKDEGEAHLAAEESRSVSEPSKREPLGLEPERPRLKMMRFTIGEPTGGVVGSGDGSTPARFGHTRAGPE